MNSNSAIPTDFNKERNQLVDSTALLIQKEHREKQDGLTRAVELYKQKYPEKYKSAQLQGGHIMNSRYELEIGVDNEGEKLYAEKLYKDYVNLGIELDDDEKEMLSKYGYELTRED